MISFMGYSCWRDVNSFDTATQFSGFDEMTVSNIKLSGINLANGYDRKYFKELPYYDAGNTIINSRFNNDVFGAFLRQDYKDINKIVIHRNSNLDSTWILVKEYILSEDSWNEVNLKILEDVMIDTVPTSQVLTYKIEYYRWVNGESVLNEDETKYVELEYQLQSNFISDKDECFPMFMNVSLTQEQNQDTAILKPLGKTHPIVLKNSRMNYKTGTFSAMVMTSNVIKNLQTGSGFKLALKQELMLYKEKLLKFLTNGKIKCFRLIDGEVMYAMITGNVSVSWNHYQAGYICNIRFNYTEIDDGETKFYK